MRILVRRGLLAVFLLIPASAHAHGGGSLTIDPRVSVAGGAVKIWGSGLPKRGVVKVELRASFANFVLANGVRTDKDGKFALDVHIPAQARPGGYEVVAIAADGDVAARLDIEIHAGATMVTKGPATAQGGSMADMPEMPGMSGATAEPMKIERSNTLFEWVTAGLLIGLSAIGGVRLLRVPRRRREAGDTPSALPR